MRILLNIGTKLVTKDIIETATVSDLENMIVSQEGLEAGEFMLALEGEELESTLSLVESGVETGSVLDLAHVVDGGKKKKKKKKYSTPKKTKHRHKNVKLRILTYYNVESDGSVKRAKKPSPFSSTSQTGRITYLANHKDGRFYCGKAERSFIPKRS